MADQTDDLAERVAQEALAEQELPQADATIDLRMEKGELLINIAGPQDRLSNEAVHFANWIGRNLPALVALARVDREAQTQVLDQARAIADLAKPATGPVIAEPPAPRLVSADGKLLQ